MSSQRPQEPNVLLDLMVQLSFPILFVAALGWAVGL
jgi:hypothetical protein